MIISASAYMYLFFLPEFSLTSGYPVTETISASALATVSSQANVNVTTTVVSSTRVYVNVTTTILSSTHSTTTSTLTKDQTKETCQARRAAGPVEKRGWNALPADCYTFLMSKPGSTY